MLLGKLFSFWGLQFLCKMEAMTGLSIRSILDKV